jgi:hypothetical protein
MAATIWNPETESVQKMTIWIPDGSVFGGLLYAFSLKMDKNGFKEEKDYFFKIEKCNKTTNV